MAATGNLIMDGELEEGLRAIREETLVIVPRNGFALQGARLIAHPTRSRPRNFVFSCPAMVLIQPNASSMRFLMRRLMA